jgi:hypothetical protein
VIDRRTRIAQCVSSKHLRTLFYSLLLLWLVADGGARLFCEKRNHVPVRPAGAPPATSWVGWVWSGGRETAGGPRGDDGGGTARRCGQLAIDPISQ